MSNRNSIIGSHGAKRCGYRAASIGIRNCLEKSMKQQARIFIVFFLLSAFTASAWAQESEGMLYLPGDQMEAYWVIEKKVAPHYPRNALAKGIQGCAAVAFVIEPDGTTSNHKVVVHSSDLFKAPSIKAAEQFLYKPSEKNPGKESVITSNTFTYQISNGNRSDEKNMKALHDLCSSKALEALTGATSVAGAGTQSAIDGRRAEVARWGYSSSH